MYLVLPGNSRDALVVRISENLKKSNNSPTNPLYFLLRFWSPPPPQGIILNINQNFQGFWVFMSWKLFSRSKYCLLVETMVFVALNIFTDLFSFRKGSPTNDPTTWRTYDVNQKWRGRWKVTTSHPGLQHNNNNNTNNNKIKIKYRLFSGINSEDKRNKCIQVLQKLYFSFKNDVSTHTSRVKVEYLTK